MCRWCELVRRRSPRLAVFLSPLLEWASLRALRTNIQIDSGVPYMSDQSHLDQKYFIDHAIYNCPFCNRRHVTYDVIDHQIFHWSKNKICLVIFVRCNSCNYISMHLSFKEPLQKTTNPHQPLFNRFREGVDIDSMIFHSIPTSFFVLDERIPVVIRELISEAEGSLKMNFLTGASACARKAIYELTIKENATGADYEGKIKSLKAKFSAIDPDLFDVLAHIQDMTSDKIHEQSWNKWESPNLTLIIETLKVVLHEIYVVPMERKARSNEIQKLRQEVVAKKRPEKADPAKSEN